MKDNTLLLVIIAVLLPPLAVGLKAGFGGSFLLNLVLTLIFWLPGLIHALLVVLKGKV
ncbi:MAG: YqaE/Pmp3 family membrane protein [Verrucomicrobiales bacterium]